MTNRTNGLVLVLALIANACGGGAPGATGPAGPKGQSGAQGATGSDGMDIQSTLNCGKVDTGSGLSLSLRYENVAFTNGAHFITCYIGGSYASYTNSTIYKASQNGAASGSCQVEADLDTSTAGYWVFTSSGGVTKAVYNDPGSTHDQYTYTFLSADCL